MSSSSIDQLNPEQRKEAAAWLAGQIESAPEFFRPVLESMLTNLAAGQVSKKQFNTFSRQLARALGIIPSSENNGAIDGWSTPGGLLQAWRTKIRFLGVFRQFFADAIPGVRIPG